MNDPLDIINQHDSALYDAVRSNREFAFAEGALPVKTKLLIALAIDAVLHAENGVRTLTEQALKAGATRQEVIEALRISYLIGGVGATYAAVPALKDLFSD